jgi:hypothetical protein
VIAQSILDRLSTPKPVESRGRVSLVNFRNQTLSLTREEYASLDILHMATWGEFIVTIRAKSESEEGYCATFCFYRMLRTPAAANALA